MIWRTSVRPTGIERRGRLVQEDELRDRRGGPRRGPGAAACPWRTCPPGRSARSARPTVSSAAIDLRRRAGSRQAGQVGVEAQDLAGAQPGLVAEELGQVADPATRLAVADRRPEDPAAARCGCGQAQEQLDRGRLASAVRAEEPEDLARLDPHRQPGQGDDPPELLGQLVGLDRRGRGRALEQGRSSPASSHGRSAAGPVTRPSSGVRFGS